MTMASHISMLLRLLQVKIRHIMSTDEEYDMEGNPRDTVTGGHDSFEEIMFIVKIHQRLIK